MEIDKAQAQALAEKEYNELKARRKHCEVKIAKYKRKVKQAIHATETLKEQCQMLDIPYPGDYLND